MITDDHLIASETHLLFRLYEIDLVTNNHNWDGSFRAEYLGSKGFHLEKRVRVVNVVNQNEGIGRFDGKISHRRELVRAGCIENIESQLNPGNIEISVMHFLNGPLVLRAEGAVKELVNYC